MDITESQRQTVYDCNNRTICSYWPHIVWGKSPPKMGGNLRRARGSGWENAAAVTDHIRPATRAPGRPYGRRAVVMRSLSLRAMRASRHQPSLAVDPIRFLKPGANKPRERIYLRRQHSAPGQARIQPTCQPLASGLPLRRNKRSGRQDCASPIDERSITGWLSSVEILILRFNEIPVT